MKLYSIDVKCYMTAYIQADSPEEAAKIAADSFTMTEGGIRDGEYLGDGIEVHGGTYNIDMPEVSVSPVFTFHGPDPDSAVEWVEDLDEEDEDAEGDEA